jgi:hypothetical protein
MSATGQLRQGSIDPGSTRFGLRFQSLGLVKEPERGAPLSSIFGHEIGPCVHDGAQSVNLIMCRSLVCPP